MTVLFLESGVDALRPEIHRPHVAVDKSFVEVCCGVACKVFEEELEKASLANIKCSLRRPDDAHLSRLLLIAIRIRDILDFPRPRGFRLREILFAQNGLSRPLRLYAIQSRFQSGERICKSNLLG